MKITMKFLRKIGYTLNAFLYVPLYWFEKEGANESVKKD